MSEELIDEVCLIVAKIASGVPNKGEEL
jgi:hypothetical protein